MKRLTAKEIAEHYEVEKRVVQGWIQKGYFPNAIKEGHAIFGDVWLVPVSDLTNFILPTAGRPKKERKIAA